FTRRQALLRVDLLTCAFGAKRTCTIVWLDLLGRHRLCTAPIVSAGIKVPVSADAMLGSELTDRYAATRVHDVVGGVLAACSARTAAGEKPQGRTAPSGGVYEKRSGSERLGCRRCLETIMRGCSHEDRGYRRHRHKRVEGPREFRPCLKMYERVIVTDSISRGISWRQGPPQGGPR